MVLYLGLDYHEKAVTERRNLLGKCLIAVPQHLDQVEEYVHKGKLQDEKYRFPWKRAKTDERFLIEEGTNVHEDAERLITDDSIKSCGVESFSSQQRPGNTSLTGTVNFDLDCDVVPNSFPSTPDPFTPDDFFTENSFQEIFQKENLTYFSANSDHLKIEPLLNADKSLTECLSAVPDLSCLASRLKTVQVKDPVLHEHGQSVSEDVIFRGDRIYSEETDVPMIQKVVDTDIFTDTFQKVALYEDCQTELEDVVPTDLDYLGSDSVNLMKADLLIAVTIDKTTFVIEEETDIMTMISQHVVKPDQKTFQKIEKLDWSPTTSRKPSFLDVNEIMFTEQDRFCEQAILDSPVVHNTSSEEQKYSQQPLPLPVMESFDRPLPESCLLDDEKREILMQRIWQSEKYCDEIQASRLPEPEFPKTQKKREDRIKQAKEVLNVSIDATTGNADLELAWVIVKYTEDMTDPCKLISPFTVDKSDVVDQLKEIEKLDRYEAADMYDWHDEKISLGEKKECKSVHKIPDGYQKEEDKTDAGLKREMCLNLKLSDPLGDFMALRSKHAAPKRKDEAATTWSDSGVINTEATQCYTRKQAEEQIAKLKLTFESKKRVKHHVVEIKISEEFQQVLRALETASENCMHILKQSGEISQSSTFNSITPDISRFLLKQKEKYIIDSGETGLSDEEYRTILTLHGFTGASEITVNCCLESAIGYLNALQEKYKDILGASLDGIRQKLFESKAYFLEKKIYHPKVMSLCKEIDTWLKKKRAKSRDKEQKILILVRREMPSLLNCLKNALGVGNLLSPHILLSSESENIIESLDKHNCLIAHQNMISDQFPWAQFSLVVEYENQEPSPWQQLCERQHIRHIGLIMLSETKGDMSNTEWTSQYPDKQISLIGSQKMTRNTELLQLLEARHNILLVERDYTLLCGASHLFFSDLDVDVNTAIVLEDMKDLGDDCVVQNMVTKMAALSLKYVTCWFIIYSSNKVGSYLFPGHVISNISRLQAAVVNFVHTSSCFSAKIVFCNDCGEVSSVIRNISENCMIMNNNGPISQWLDRSWLCNDILQGEKFLLMLPCLNSFSAQLLIQRVSLKGIFQSSVEDLAKAVPEISSIILQNLKKLVNSNTGLPMMRDHSIGTPTVELADQCVIDCTEISEHDHATMKIKDMGEEEDEVEHFIAADNDIHRDLYIPEDFQKSDNPVLNTVEHGEINMQDKRSRAQHVSCRNEMDYMYAPEKLGLCNGSGKSFNEAKQMHIRDNTEQRKTEMNETGVRMNNTCNDQQLNTSKETCTKNTEVANGWETLNQYVATKINLDNEELQCISLIENVENSTSLRKLTPVERLQIMRQKDRSQGRKLAQRQEDSNFINGRISYDDDDSQYCRGISENWTNVPVVKSKEIDNTRKSLQDFADTCKRENPRVDHYLENSDKLIYIERNYDRCMFDRAGNQEKQLQDLRQNTTAECNNQNSRQSLSPNTFGQHKTTFDYNHGFPLQIPEASSQHHDNSGRWPTDTRSSFGKDENVDAYRYTNKLRHIEEARNQHYQGYSTGCRTPKNMKDLEKEFPPADEIDRSVRLETKRDTLTDNVKSMPSISNDEMTSSNVDNLHGSVTENTTKHSTDNDNFVDYCQSIKPFSSNAMTAPQTQLHDSVIPHNYEMVPKCNIEFQTEEESASMNANPSTVEFDFKPNYTIDVYNNKETEPGYTDTSHQLFLNPNLKRITHRQDSQVDRASHDATSATPQTLSLANDLRETTRKYLANSQQFSRFETRSKRHPLQKVSIGLAQPRLRRSSKINEGKPGLSEEERMRMVQSPWTTDASPPMDLDYDNSQINQVLFHQNHGTKELIDISNRVVFSNATPRKKRKLSYMCIPGKKGQTKLVFK